MKTVLHLIETSGMGGAERVLVDLVSGIDRNRWRPIVVVPWSGWLLDRLTEQGIETVELRERGPIDIRCLSQIVGVTRRTGADIIHSHLFGSAVRAGIVSRICAVPAVGTIHGVGDFRRDERWSALKLGIVRRGLRKVVFVSEPLRQACLESMQLPASRTQVISNGVDADRFSPKKASELRVELGISNDAFVVGCVGRLQPVKGIEVLLEAASILRATSPAYRFVIVGDGDPGYLSHLIALSNQLGVEKQVVFVGSRVDVSDAMAAFDVYALTSRSEGFSLSTIEAMAAGLPVVATRCGGPEQILSDGMTGLLVENGSARAVARAIERLRVDPGERSRLAAAAREAVVERFTVQAQARAYEDLYERVLLPHGRDEAIAS